MKEETVGAIGLFGAGGTVGAIARRTMRSNVLERTGSLLDAKDTHRLLYVWGGISKADGCTRKRSHWRGVARTSSSSLLNGLQLP